MAVHKNSLHVLGPIPPSIADASTLVFRASATLLTASDSLKAAKMANLATPIAAVYQDIYSREKAAQPEFEEDSRSKILIELPDQPREMSLSADALVKYFALCRLVGAASCLMRAGHDISALRVRRLGALFVREAFYEHAVVHTLQIVDGNSKGMVEWLVN